MKRITFKKPFNGFGNALKLIPNKFRVEGKEFIMTDLNETYQVKWSNGKGNIITASDNKVVKEDFNRLKQLMNYKSEDTLGLVKGENRINEDKRFNKSIISEDLGAAIHKFINDPKHKSPEETKGAKVYANPDKHKELGKMLSNDEDEETDKTNEGVEPVCDCENIKEGDTPSSSLSKKEKSNIVKKAKAGEDIGKPGKNFEKVANKAAKEYGSKEAGERVAAAAMWKNKK